MDRNEFARMRELKDLQCENNQLKIDLRHLKSTLLNHLDKIDEIEAVRYSGQYGLFEWNCGEYVCLGVISEDCDEDEFYDDIMNRVSMILPLPDHETLNEWDGF